MSRLIDPNNPASSPLLVVISGPSGVGKDVTLKHMQEMGCPFHFVVTTTDRPPRPGEIDGVDYVFVSTAERQSSRRRMGAPVSHARAMDVRCLSPPERVTPRSPTMVS